jgi:hypothetical protein
LFADNDAIGGCLLVLNEETTPPLFAVTVFVVAS